MIDICRCKARHHRHAILNAGKTTEECNSMTRSSFPFSPAQSCAPRRSQRLHLNIGTLRYRSAKRPETTYNHHRIARGAACSNVISEPACWDFITGQTSGACAHLLGFAEAELPIVKEFEALQYDHVHKRHRYLKRCDGAGVWKFVDCEDSLVEECDRHRHRSIAQAGCYLS